MADINADVRWITDLTQAQITSGGIKAGQHAIASDTGAAFQRSADGLSYYQAKDGTLQVNSSDENPSFLATKLQAGSGVTLTVAGTTNPIMTIDASGAQDLQSVVEAGDSSTNPIVIGDTYKTTITGLEITPTGPLQIGADANATTIKNAKSGNTATEREALGSSALAALEDIGTPYPYETVQDPTGFIDTEIEVTYNSTSRTVTLNDSGTHLVGMLWQGEVVPAFIDGWESPAHDVPSGAEEFFLKYDATNGVTWSSTPWNFKEAPIALVYRDGANFCLREVHGCNMDADSHRAGHYAVGTFLDPTVAGGFYDFETGSTTATDRRPKIAEHRVFDEDIPTTLNALTTNAYSWLTLSEGSSGVVISGSNGGTYDSTYADTGTTDTVNGLPVYTDGTNRIIRDTTDNYWVLDTGTGNVSPIYFNGQYYNTAGTLLGTYSGLGANAGDTCDAIDSPVVGATTTLTTDNTEIVGVGANTRFNWNEYTAGGWITSQSSGGDYGKCFVMGVPVTADSECQKARYIIIPPQQVGNLSTIQEVQASSVELGSISSALQEYVFIGEIILRSINNNWRLQEVNEYTGSRLAQTSRPSGGLTVGELNTSEDITLVEATNFQMDDDTSKAWPTDVYLGRRCRVATSAIANGGQLFTVPANFYPTAPEYFTMYNTTTGDMYCCVIDQTTGVCTNSSGGDLPVSTAYRFSLTYHR